MRRVLLAVTLLASLSAAPAQGQVAVAVFDGRGFGHGVGMAQDGAFWMGKGGATTEQILGAFFPGTARGRARGDVRVPVVDAGAAPAAITLTFPTGGLVRDAPPSRPARSVDLRVRPGGSVRVHWDGARYVVDDGTAATRRVRTAQAPLPTTPGSTSTTSPPAPTPTSAPPPAPSTSTTSTTSPASSTTTTTAPARPSGPSSTDPIWSIPDRGGAIGVPAREGRSYRGAIEVTGQETLRAVNEVDVEQYLKGMGEVRDPTWPVAALQAQAIAARTYALRAMATGGEICDTQRCQVYLGAQAEYAAMTRAVDATAGQVLTFGKGLASAVYSANGGGHSASREEGFGQSGEGYPYLRPAPYETQDPEPWKVEVSLADVAAQLGYPGRLDDLTVSAVGPSGRAREVRLLGSAGEQVRSGLAVAQALRLKSTLFSVQVGSAATAPPAPDGESIVQAPPELAHELAEPARPAAADAAATAVSAGPTTADQQPAGRAGDSGGLALWAAIVVVLVGAWAARAAQDAGLVDGRSLNGLIARARGWRAPR